MSAHHHAIWPLLTFCALSGLQFEFVFQAGVIVLRHEMQAEEGCEQKTADACDRAVVSV